MRDLYNNLGVVAAIPPAVYAADNTPILIDLDGFESAMLTLQVGVGGITFDDTNKIEFVLSHSDDGTNFDPVTTDDLLGVLPITDGIIYALKVAHASPSINKVGYCGNRRHLKLLADFSGTHGVGTPIAATVVKGGARSRPVA